MAHNDIIQGLFTLIACGFVCTNIIAAIRDKKVNGVRPYAEMFFIASAAWFTFNMVYLEQYFTAVAGGVAVATHVTYATLLIYYSIRKDCHESERQSARAIAA